ncbi:MAG: hypothetical protein CUN57_02425, partial [Phototrophicales bacterium]
FGYEEVITESYTIAENETLSVHLDVLQIPTGTLRGYTTDAYLADAPPIADVEIQLSNTPLLPITTNEDGFYQFEHVPVGSYFVHAFHPDYLMENQEVTVTADQMVSLHFPLIPIEGFEQDNGNFSGQNEWEWGTPDS